MSERLQYRFAFQIDRRQWGPSVLIEKLRREHRKISRATIQRELDKLKRKALRLFFETEGEEEFPGVRIVAQWRNPDRRISRNWRSTEDASQSLPDFYKTMHGSRGALRQAWRDAIGR
jgi:hypothetical protein